MIVATCGRILRIFQKNYFSLIIQLNYQKKEKNLTFKRV